MDLEPTSGELAELMQKAKSGDKDAYAAVYRHFFAPVFRYTLRRIGNTRDAEDIAQTVFLKVYSAKTTFENRSITPLAYLFTAARNLIADHWQKNGRAGVVPLPEEDNIADDRNLEAQVKNKVTVEQVLKLLNTEQRTVIQLRILEGKETCEVARLLNKTEMAVRQIQCRALKELKKLFAI